MLFWLTAVALAHRPHAVIPGAAIDPDGADWALLDREGVLGLLRSDDDGSHWDFVGGTPASEVLVDLELLSNGTLAALSEDGTLWWTTSPGETDAVWSQIELTGLTGQTGQTELTLRSTRLTTDGEQVAVATEEGLILGSPGGSFSMVLGPEAVRTAAFEPDGSVLVVMTLGGVQRVATDGSTERLPDPPEAAWAVIHHDGAVYAGTEQGVVVLADDVWSACGALPTTSEDSYAEVVSLLESDGQRLMAATGREALFVSEDGCQSWTHLDAGQRPAYDGLGLAETPDQGYTRLYWRGDRVVVAGFNGVSGSDDNGASWREATVIPPDSVRGVSFASEWPHDPRLWFGGYGGGGWWTDDGGNTWEGSATGLTGEGPYGNALYSYDITADGYDAVYIGALIPYRYDGERWQPLDPPLIYTASFDVQHGLLLAFGSASGRGYNEVALSRDDGASWDLMDGLNAVAAEVGISGLQWSSLEGTAGWLLTGAQRTAAWFSEDGETWEPLLDQEGEGIGGATWPPLEGARVVVVSRDGTAWLSDDRGGDWRAVDIGSVGDLRGYAAADDGTLFVSDRSGQLRRSDDGGETWAAVGQALPAPLNLITTAPDFARTGALMAGTWGGAWWSGDRGETWSRVPRYLRAEAASIHFRCLKADRETWCEQYQEEAEGFGGGWEMASGDLARFSAPGDAVTLLGGQGGDQATVSIDGEEYAIEGAGPHRFEGLGAGWHDVDIVTDGAFHVDAFEVMGEGEAMIPAPELKDAGCGCQSTSDWGWGWGWGWGWLGALVLGWRRQRPR